MFAFSPGPLRPVPPDASLGQREKLQSHRRLSPEGTAVHLSPEARAELLEEHTVLGSVSIIWVLSTPHIPCPHQVTV